ncbi:MAG TPA: hypothetical protein DCZ80_05175 [Legionellales bacterium]|nr:hypothetical protein [Legionellales bacterium]
MLEYTLTQLKNYLLEHPEIEKQLPESYVLGLKKFDSEHMETIQDVILALFEETKLNEEWCLVFKDQDRYPLEPEFCDTYYLMHDNNTYQLLELCHQLFPENFVDYIVTIVTHPRLHSLLIPAFDMAKSGKFSDEQGLMVWDEFIDHHQLDKHNISIIHFIEKFLEKKDELPLLNISPVPEYEVERMIGIILSDEDLEYFNHYFSLNKKTLILNVLMNLDNIDFFAEPHHTQQLIEFIQGASLVRLQSLNHFIEMVRFYPLDAHLIIQAVEVFFRHPQYHEGLANILIHLSILNIFSEENLVILGEIGNLDTISGLFSFLTDSGVMTDLVAQELFQGFLPHLEAIESSNAFQLLLFGIVNEHEFTVENWQEILQMLVAGVPEDELNDFVMGILNTQNRLLQEIDVDEFDNLVFNNAAFNPSQSTHTSSVHQTVSESAIRLKNTYFIDNEEDALSSIEDYLKSLDQDNYNNAAALRAFHAIADNYYHYKDMKSKTTLLELLILTWVAVHDDEKRLGSKEDVLKLWVQSLNDIQRDYQNDNPRHLDKPICGSGAFNKLIQGIASAHELVEIRYLTLSTFTLKLKASVQTLMIDYLKALSNPQTLKEFLLFNQQCYSIEKNGVEAFWPFMKDYLSRILFDEFGSLFQSQTDPKFQLVLDSAEYIQIENTHQFQKEIGESKGCYQFFQFCLFSKISDNPEERRLLTLGDI